MQTVYKVVTDNGSCKLFTGTLIQLPDCSAVAFRAKVHHLSGEQLHITERVSDWKGTPEEALAVPMKLMIERHESEIKELSKLISTTT